MKAPAFQLYADDFLAGTMDLSQAEVGAYIRLLCVQWAKGSIPSDHAKIERIAGGPVSDDVLAKFPTGDDGARRNKRLESVRLEQNEYRDKQAKNGAAGAAARWHRHSDANGTANGETMATPMANGMANAWPNYGSPSPSPSPSPISNLQSSSPLFCDAQAPKKQKKPQHVVPPSLEDVKARMIEKGKTESDAERFFSFHEARGWVMGKGMMKNWHAALNYWNSNGIGHATNGTSTSLTGPGARLASADLWHQQHPKSELAKDDPFPCA